MRGGGKARRAQAGLAYLALLIAIAIIGVAAAASAQLGAIYQRRMAEEELLAVGGEFQRALLSYAAATPLGQPTQPRMLDDLVRDPRYPNAVRHLRKVYADPMTGKADWVLVKSPDGQTIVGIHSVSKAHPIKISHFPGEFQGFTDKKSYADWVFVARFPTLAPGGGLPNQSPGGMTPGGGLSNQFPTGMTPGGGLPSQSPGGMTPGGGLSNQFPTGMTPGEGLSSQFPTGMTASGGLSNQFPTGMSPTGGP
jgi:type II secretory pathway pseudopilin PulG